MRALVVVLGDFGRSPRMQYHALALADSGAQVEVIAYEGAAPLRAISEHPRISLHLIPPLSAEDPSMPARVLFVLLSAVRIAAQGIRVLWKMMTVKRPDVILVQNPPALPTLIICLIAARMRSTRLVVDWHNFSHSMLALKLPAESWSVRTLRALEMSLGRHADANLCVSQAMKVELQRWAIPDAVVLRDRPARTFSSTPSEMREQLVQRCLDIDPPILNGTRPAIIICPTSWSADEDMSILIEAAAQYDRRASAPMASSGSALPGLLLVITGQGPMRTQYEVQISRTKLIKVTIQTAWLSAEDYVSLMGSADLGVSCHRSASGVDLAMKVADMFGAGIPVCAFDYGPCLAEQVHHGVTGMLFKDADQLAAQFAELLAGFPNENRLLAHLREGVAHLRSERWEDGWKREAAPLLLN